MSAVNRWTLQSKDLTYQMWKIKKSQVHRELFCVISYVHLLNRPSRFGKRWIGFMKTDRKGQRRDPVSQQHARRVPNTFQVPSGPVTRDMLEQGLPVVPSATRHNAA